MRVPKLWVAIFVGVSITVSVDCRAQNPPQNQSGNASLNQSQELSPAQELSPDHEQGLPQRRSARKERREERKRLKNAPVALPELSRGGFKVSGGQRIKSDSIAAHIVDSLEIVHDSLTKRLPHDPNAMKGIVPGAQGGDSLIIRSTVPKSYTHADSLSYPTLLELHTPVEGYKELGEKYTQSMRDSTLQITDSVGGVSTMRLTGTAEHYDSKAMPEMTSRERRRLRRELMRGDTTLYRHSKLFRDTIPLSRLTFFSLIAPGFGQLYNGQYWKMPILYATVGTSLYFGIRQNKQYVKYRDQYNGYLRRDPDRKTYIAEMDLAQTRMIQHNTWRQLLFAGAVGSYLYFLCDEVLNYPNQKASVKIATTLSTIFPGAGQFYNKSFWKIPIVVGGFASMLYVIDWNDRIYQRYRTAYIAVTDNDPLTEPQSGMSKDATALKNVRDSARRNRDLCYILTGLLYLFNIMDAHVDAHLKDYDISDDLTERFRLEPSIDVINTRTAGTTGAFGLNLSYRF